MREQVYEEERLLLYVQEAIADAIQESGLSRTEIAVRLGKHRSFVTQALSSGRNLTLGSIAGLAWAAGFRIQPKLEALAAQASRQAPVSTSLSSSGANEAPVISITRALSQADRLQAHSSPSGSRSGERAVNAS